MIVAAMAGIMSRQRMDAAARSRLLVLACIRSSATPISSRRITLTLGKEAPGAKALQSILTVLTKRGEIILVKTGHPANCYVATGLSS